ncbi:MAG: fasciclin protein [Burkholderia sp.]|nr:fasciclin protein [Burkholderia sp.]
MTKPFSAIAFVLLLCAGHTMASDLVETASSSGEIKTFVAALKSAGVADSLKSDGPYTIFAPADSAFAKLDPDTKNDLMKDKKKLAQVLTYHVIPGKVMVAEVKPGKVQTMEGASLTLKSDNGKVTVDDANVTQSDVTADNGVIHIIDTVVLPKQ